MELNSFYNLYENSQLTNIVLVLSATFIAIFLSIVLPLIDKQISKKLGISLQGGLEDNVSAAAINRYRFIILNLTFILYLAILVYIVIFARSVNEDYLVRNSGIRLFIMSWQGIDMPAMEFMEFYLNLMLFIPMGYLLPYVYKFFRRRAIIKPLIASFLVSVLIENLQLMTKRGTYDSSDVIANTLGSLIGSALYIQFAYILTNPNWRKEYRNYLHWRKLAKSGILFRYVGKFSVTRVSLLASDEENVWNFYTKLLGFQPKNIVIPEASSDSYFLFSTGKTQIEVHCLNRDEKIPKQSITISYKNLEKLRSHLQKHNIPVSDFKNDIFTKQKTMSIVGPDDVEIIFLEI